MIQCTTINHSFRSQNSLIIIVLPHPMPLQIPFVLPFSNRRKTFLLAFAIQNFLTPVSRLPASEPCISLPQEPQPDIHIFILPSTYSSPTRSTIVSTHTVICHDVFVQKRLIGRDKDDGFADVMRGRMRSKPFIKGIFPRRVNLLSSS